MDYVNSKQHIFGRCFLFLELHKAVNACSSIYAHSDTVFPAVYIFLTKVFVKNLKSGGTSL